MWVTCKIEGIRDKGPVPCPEVAVMVRRPLGNVRIVRGQNSPATIDLCLHDQKRALVHFDHRPRQAAKVRFILVHPRPPIVFGVIKIFLRALFEDVLITGRRVFVLHTSYYPIIELERSGRLQGKVDADRRIDRAFGDRLSAEGAVLRITPRSFLVAESFSAGSERIEWRLGINQKIAVLFVMDQRVRFGVEIGRVANFVFIDAKIMVEENAKLASFRAQVRDPHLSKEYVFVAGHSVVRNDLDAQGLIQKKNISNQGFRKIAQLALPRIGIHPRKFADCPYPKAKREAFGMIFLARVRKIDVADLILVVEIYEKAPVPDRDVTHRVWLSCLRSDHPHRFLNDLALVPENKQFEGLVNGRPAGFGNLVIVL